MSQVSGGGTNPGWGASGGTPAQGQGQQVDLGQVLTAMNQRMSELMVGMTNLRRRVWAREALDKLQAAGREARMPLVFRSAMGEDIVLWELLGGQLDGFYVEAGAADGKTASLSYVFDALGWDGVLIEGRPDAADAARTNRPNARVEHAALTRGGRTGEGTMHVPERANLYSYLTTGKRTAERLSQSGAIHEVKAPLKTLNEVLGDLDRRIDILIIDLVGGEVDALAGFDREKYKPRLICIDTQYDTASGQTVEGFMQGTGYRLITQFAGSRIYVREDEEDIVNNSAEIIL